MTAFLSSNWETISLAALILVNILNAATKHWSTKTGLVKWLLFLSEILSFVKSGSLKFPFSSVKSIIVLFVAGALLSGCVTSATGEKKFSPDSAMQIACHTQPAVSHIQAIVCESIQDPEKKKKCWELKGKMDLYGSAIIGIANSIYGACKIR